MNNKWDLRFLKLAEHISQWSKDPSTKVGAVITDSSNRVVSVGYNGHPAGTNDDESLYIDRELKYCRIVHAELNAILFAQRDLSKHTLYTWPFPPCERCAGPVIQSGITKIVAPYPSEDLIARWKDNLNNAYQLFEEADVDVLLVEDIL